MLGDPVVERVVGCRRGTGLERRHVGVPLVGAHHGVDRLGVQVEPRDLVTGFGEAGASASRDGVVEAVVARMGRNHQHLHHPVT